MFGRGQKGRGVAVGIAAGPSGISVALIEGATAEKPRVLECAQLSDAGAGLEQFCRERGLQGAVCVDSLPPGRYSLMQVELQNLKAEERVEAVRWQIRELLDYPAEEAIIDLIDIPIVGSEDNARKYAVAAASSFLKDRVAQLGSLGLRLQAIDIAELSLRNLLELYPEEARGLCFLWVRDNDSLLIITREDRLYFSRLISIGLNQMSSPAGLDPSAPVPETVQTQLDGVVLEIQRSIDYCESNFRLPQVPKVLVAVCGQEPPFLLDSLNRYLQAEVVSADLRQVLDLPLDLDPPIVNACLPALGAALRAGGRI